MSKYTTQTSRVVLPRRSLTLPPTRFRPMGNTAVHSRVPVVRPASRVANTTNLGGGKAFKMSDKMELVTTSLVGLIRQKGPTVNPDLGAFVTQRANGIRCYESDEQREQRIKALIPLTGAEFAAKLSLSLRKQHGQRSISHLLNGLIASQCSGEPWADDFFAQVMVRADDACETVAAYQKHGKKTKVNKQGRLPLPASLKRGIAKFFGRLDYYKIAKYANRDGWPKLHDLVNMCRPTPTDKNRQALHDLAHNQIKNTETWEAKLSACGQKGSLKTKQQVWQQMIEDEELGQLALLRNLRNIMTECNEKTVKLACKQLVNKDAIKKNGILPMQYFKAYEVIGQVTSPYTDMVRTAIDDAVEIAAGNVPSLGDDVLIAIDESGSMEEIERNNAAMFAAVLIKANPNAEVLYFATEARYETFNRKLPIMELMTAIRGRMKSGATNFNKIFQLANKAYDAIVILSDQEGWMGSDNRGGGLAFQQRTEGGAPTKSMQTYKTEYNCNPTIFTFDLGGDGALMFREDGIIALAGFSFHVFKLLSILKQDRTKLTDVIDRIVIGKPLPVYGEDED